MSDSEAQGRFPQFPLSFGPPIVLGLSYRAYEAKLTVSAAVAAGQFCYEEAKTLVRGHTQIGTNVLLLACD